jgi:hypothetical protein
MPLQLFIDSFDTDSIGLPKACENSSTNSQTSPGMSPARLRSGGIVTGNTLSR